MLGVDEELRAAWLGLGLGLGLGLRLGLGLGLGLRFGLGLGFLDALDGGGGHIRGEVLVAVDGEPLLERELEPVAAGDAVAAPVVEVLVRHHTLHTLVVALG